MRRYEVRSRTERACLRIRFAPKNDILSHERSGPDDHVPKLLQRLAQPANVYVDRAFLDT